MWNSAGLEYSLAKSISDFSKVKILYCDSFLDKYCIAHSAEHLSINSSKKSKLKICTKCKTQRNIYNSKSHNIEFIKIDDYINYDLVNKINLTKFTKKDLISFKINGISVGRMCLFETLLDNHKDSLIFDSDTRKLIETKIKQIILFHSAIEKIYSKNKFDVSISVNGYYYLSNFFNEFNKINNLRVFSVANSNNFRFHRKHLRIYKNHQLDEERLIKKTWNSYDSIPIFKKSIIKCLLLVKSNLLKEHSHAFSSKLKKSFSVRDFFNIPSDKKLVLITLSSGSEIFAAQVASERFKLDNKKHKFKTQLDYLKFIKNNFSNNKDIFFIVRLHPRLYKERKPDELKKILKLNLHKTHNIKLNTPDQNISAFNFIGQVDLIINSWSSLVVDFGIFGIGNITIFPEYTSYPRNFMVSFKSKKDLLYKIKNISIKNSLYLSKQFLRFRIVDQEYGSINFENLFKLTKNYSNFFNDKIEKFFFKYIYSKFYNIFSNKKLNVTEYISLKRLLNITNKKVILPIIKVNLSKSLHKNDFLLNDSEIIEIINNFSTKNFNYKSF
jgi:ssDNA-binding Zn-finger/Zn-ribbon topoisomerase 1